MWLLNESCGASRKRVDPSRASVFSLCSTKGGLMDCEWAGVSFLTIGHHDGRLIRAPGLWGFARRAQSGEFTLLFLDHADAINQAAGPGHALWVDALSLGMNEVHICLKAKTRIDRLQLRSHIVRRVQPLLNMLEDVSEVAEEISWPQVVRLRR